MLLKFGKYKGKEISEVANDNDGASYLDWLRTNTDGNDPKYGKSNQALLAEINKALNGKTIYKSEKKGFRKSGSGSSPEIAQALEEIKLDLKRIKTKLGIVDADPIHEEEAPF